MKRLSIRFEWLAIGSSLVLFGCPGEEPQAASTGSGASTSSSSQSASTGGESTSSTGGSGGEGGGSGGCEVQPPAVCGRDDNGITCAFADGTSFPAISTWSAEFADSELWNAAERYRTLRFPDVNGDGLFDVCGRESAGIVCALSDGASFGPLTSWDTTFAVSFMGDPEHYYTLQFPDVNGDGKDDLCARGQNSVICHLSDGSAFVEGSFIGVAYFADSDDFDDPTQYGTIHYPDVNGDGRKDVCGRAADGIHCALSDGDSFTSASSWTSAYGNGSSWHLQPEHWSTIQFPDLNGDGMADICGHAGAGNQCGISNGSGFEGVGNWDNYFTDAAGLTDPEHYATLQYPDVNGDGLADVCARLDDGMHCAVSTGTAFESAALWTTSFRDSAGWNAPEHYRTIQFPDVNGDGMADACGRGGNGITCAISNGTSFTASSYWDSHFSNANGWVPEEYRGTIHFPLSLHGACPPTALPAPELRPTTRFGIP